MWWKDDKYKAQFKKLATMLTDIEAATLQRYKMLRQGFPVKELDQYLQQERVNANGAGMMIAMINESVAIQFNDDKTELIPRPQMAMDDGLIDAFFVEL